MSRIDELDLQFSPNRWSRRYRAEEIVHKHVEFITRASSAAERSVPSQLGVPYGSSEQEKLDIFGTELPDDAPAVVYVHGADYWQEHSREISRYAVDPLHKKGFKVIVIGYDKLPQVPLADIIKQIQKAILAVIGYVKNWGSKSLYICGYSSGAHLVASAFQSSCTNEIPEEDQDLVKAVILISGLYDVGPLTKTFVNDILKLEISEARKLSPVFQTFSVSKNILFFLIVGENDSPAYKNQSESFYSRLKAIGYTTDLITVNEVDHYDIAENMNEQHYEIVRLILQLEEY